MQLKNIINKYVPDYKQDIKEPLTESNTQASSKKQKYSRGEIVKQVMLEQGLSLPQASKYVKDKNLY